MLLSKSKACIGVMLLRSAAASLSRNEDRVGSSSWKIDNCRLPSLSRVPAFVCTGFLRAFLLRVTIVCESLASNDFRVFSALSVTSLGMPAIRATWIPKL